MANLSDLEFLRRQKASKQTNVAQGTQVLGQGEDVLGNVADSFARNSEWNSPAEQEANQQRRQQDSGSWWEKALGFVDEMAAQFGAGFVNGWEGLLDLAATGLGALGDATGWYDSKPFTDWAQIDLGKQAATYFKTYASPFNLVKSMTNGNFSNPDYWRNAWDGLINVASLGNTNREAGDYDWLADRYYGFNDRLETEAGRFIGGVANSIGFMMPSLLTGGSSQAAQLAVMGAGAAGKGSEQALNEGASTGQALGYGALSGLAEVGSEIFVGKLLGKVGLGTGEIGLKSSMKAKLFSKEFASHLSKKMFEEGVEEVSTAIIEPLLQSVYKGEDAFKDERGRNVYLTGDFWFGQDGHFSDSVLGQFTAGAVSAGLSDVARSVTVRSKVGAKGSAALQNWSDVIETDAKLKELEQEGKAGTKEYQQAFDYRTKTYKEFAQNYAEFLDDSTDRQKSNMAQYFGTDGALMKDIRKGKADASKVLNDLFSQLQNEKGTYARSRLFSDFNEMQKQNKTNVELAIEDNAKNPAYYDQKNNRIVLDSAYVETEGGKLLAHEYFGHVLGDLLAQGERTRFYDAIAESDFADSSVNDKGQLDPNGSKTWLEYIQDLYKGDSQARLEDEVVANYLQDAFNGENTALQLNQLRQVFGKKNLLRMFLDWIKRVPQFKADAITAEYARSIKAVLSKLSRITPDRIVKALVKAFSGKELTDEERALVDGFKNIVDKTKQAEPQRASKEREATNGRDNQGKALTKTQREYFKDSKIRDEDGNLERMYHGTERGDRVGYYFDPKRATAGPMAYFTNDQSIAENYSQDKTDTSIETPDSYEGWFITEDGKPFVALWNKFSSAERNRIRKEALKIGFDDEADKIVRDTGRNDGLGDLDFKLRSEPNVLKALVQEWLGDGNLFGEEERFLQVLKFLGIDEGIEYIYGLGDNRKVYQVYLNVTKPFDTSSISEKDIEGIKKAVLAQPDRSDTFFENGLYAWDKKNISPSTWLDKFESDIKNGTSYSWTIIPDYVTDYLKSQGYDGIIDQGGKNGGKGHKVVIPFYSNQIKSTDNNNPTSSNPDIRYAKRAKASAEAVEGEVVDNVEVKAEEPLVIPNSYIKDTANLYNDRVYSMNGAVEAVQKISREILRMADNVDPKKYYVSYNGNNIEKQAKKIFDAFNAKRANAEQMMKAVLDMFENVKVVARDGSSTIKFYDIVDKTGGWEELGKAVESHLKDFLSKGQLSAKARAERNLKALKDIYSAYIADIKAKAKEARAKIDATSGLVEAQKNVPEGMSERYSFNESTLQGRMSSYLASPFLMLDYRGNGNFSFTLENQQTLSAYLGQVLETYSEKYYQNHQDALPLFDFDQSLHDMIADFKAKVDAASATDRFLSAELIKDANRILRTIEKRHKAVDKRFKERLQPQVYGAKEQIAQNGGNSVSRFIALNAYSFNAASFYAIINARLGNSVFARELTVGMELADGKRVSLVGETAKAIKDKLDKLGITKELAKTATFRGQKIQYGTLIDLYASLTSESNFDALNKNGVDYVDDKRVSHSLLKAGEAEAAIQELRQLLSKEMMQFADWIKTELYNGNDPEKKYGFKLNYYAYRDEGGYSWANVLDGYYPLSAHVDGPTDFTKVVRAPKVFTNDELRKRHTHPFTVADVTRRAMKFANDLGMARFTLPAYRNNMYVLRQVWADLGNKAADIKFRDALNTTLGMWVGANEGKSKKAALVSRLFGNYTTSLLAFNPGTPLKQTISLLFSNLSLPNVIKGMGSRVFGGKEFNDKFNDLRKSFSQMAYRARNSASLNIDLTTGYRRLLSSLQKVGEVGMKLIEVMDKATIQAGLASSMAIAKDMGYSLSNKDYDSVVAELFSYFVETQIGNNPSNLSRISRGDSPLGEIVQYFPFMQGPLRAALAAMIDKYTTWRIARTWTDKSIEDAIASTTKDAEKAQAKMEAEQKVLDDLLKQRSDLKQERHSGLSEGDADEGRKAINDRLEDLKKRIEEQSAKVEQATEEYMQAYGKQLQAEQNKKTFMKYKAQGGKGWVVSTATSVMIGAFLNALIEALSKRLRGKEDWDEWDMQDVWTKTWQYASFGWLPLVSTVTNAFNHYDTSYPTGALINDFQDFLGAVSTAYENGFDEKSSKALFREAIGLLSVAFGVPVKNIYQDTFGLVRMFSKDLADQMNGLFYVNAATNAKIVSAIQDGEFGMASRYIGKYASENCGEISSSLNQEFLKLMQDGESPLPSAIPTTYTNAKGEEVTITWTQQQEAKRYYSKANAIVSKVIPMSGYRKLSSKEKSALIRSIYLAFRQAALKKAVPGFDGTLSKLGLFAFSGYSSMPSVFLAVSVLKTLKATDKKSKKDLAVEYVNKLSLSKNEKLLVLYLAGYAVDEKAVKNALMSKGVSQAVAKQMLG